MVTYRDYEFLREDFEGWLLNGACITLLHGMQASELLTALGSTVPPSSVVGYEEMNLAWTGAEGFFVGVADLDSDWALVIETAAGYMGITAAVIGPVATNHDVVSIYGTDGMMRIVWWEEAIEVVTFDPSDFELDTPWNGADPRRIVPIWDAVGPGETINDPDRGWLLIQAMFAVAESITGVRLDANTLNNSIFHLGLIPPIAPPDQDVYTRALRAADWNARALHS